MQLIWHNGRLYAFVTRLEFLQADENSHLQPQSYLQQVPFTLRYGDLSFLVKRLWSSDNFIAYFPVSRANPEAVLEDMRQLSKS